MSLSTGYPNLKKEKSQGGYLFKRIRYKKRKKKKKENGSNHNMIQLWNFEEMIVTKV